MSELPEFSVLLRRALAGESSSMIEVGECFASGDGVQKNLPNAARWYARAANNGDVGAMFELARCYCIDLGVVQDFPTARKWLTKAYSKDCLSRTPAARSKLVRDEVARLLMRFE